ncbi:MAG: hypothetical protein B0D91_14475 [Oceanospirillales bacterium LUC14_002_19_P2]|nr:MAG: hypothetical protein B0D91_14475 [Oceanospirillales bacterium LUC14_002_19_P2]
MNRNTLFRQSLLSTAIVAVLQTSTAVANAEPCGHIHNGALFIAAEESCDSVTITAENTIEAVAKAQFSGIGDDLILQ